MHTYSATPLTNQDYNYEIFPPRYRHHLEPNPKSCKSNNENNFGKREGDYSFKTKMFYVI